MTLEEAKKNIQERMNILLKRYGEWKDAHPGWFASGELIGQVEGLEEAMGILDEVDTEPVVKDKLTLTELAHELRNIFRFRYLTVDDSRCIYAWRGKKPRYLEEEKYWTGNSSEISIVLETWAHEVDLDLSEYADENGEIDFSKCIVEVTDASE